MSNTTNTAHLGYIASSVSNITETNCNYIGSLSCGNTLQSAGNLNTHNNLTITNNEYMNTQAKIVIFEVTRDEKGNINSSKFKVEFWMEKKKGASIELAAAKYLSKDFDPDLIVVKELYTANF